MGAGSCRRRRKTCALRMRQGLPTNARRRATMRLPTTTSGSSPSSVTAGVSSPAGIIFNGFSSGETLRGPASRDGLASGTSGPGGSSCPDLPDPVRADRSRRDCYASRAPRAHWGCVMADLRWRRPSTACCSTPPGPTKAIQEHHFALPPYLPESPRNSTPPPTSAARSFRAPGGARRGPILRGGSAVTDHLLRRHRLVLKGLGRA